MILQALDRYYHRLSEDPEVEIPASGFSLAKIHFELILDERGNLFDVADIRDDKGKKKIPKMREVPEAAIRTAGIKANFLWDSTAYVLGADGKEKPEKALKKFQAFRDLTHQIGDGLDDPGMKAVLAFLDSWDPARAASLSEWDEMAGLNLVFRLQGVRGYVHQSPAVRQAWLEYRASQTGGETGQCLISGRESPLAATHPKIKGVMGAQTSGASLVSFNLDAFTSYGKKQNYNSPIGEEAAFNYTTVLNRLLRPESKQKVNIGDAATVFWTERESKIPEAIAKLISGYDPEEDEQTAEDQALTIKLKGLLEAAKQGTNFGELDAQNPFYILSLSPNSSRLSVRNWLVSSEGEIKNRIGEHLNDLELVRQWDSDPEYPPLWALLRETAVLRKSDNISPQLAGAMSRGLLTGGAYPRSLLSAVLNRIRADQRVNYLRAAMIKAYLQRLRRLNQNYRQDKESMEVTVSLDEKNTNTAYRLGRLFAVLENLQRAAQGQNLNRTIADTYMASASATPKVVFPRLLSLAENHRKKAASGGYFKKLIQEILEPLPAEAAFPAHLKLEQQGQFFMGYYHQRQDLFTSKKDKNVEE